MTVQLGALDDHGQPVDWWFMYKLPKHARPAPGSGSDAPPTTGYEYLYYDPRSAALTLSPSRLDQPANALRATLGQIYDSPADSFAWLFYNDEFPLELQKGNDSRKAHAKGLLAFDTASDSAFWLSHSIPRFPSPSSDDFPADELVYGQTLLCITLHDVATAETIAGQMLAQHGPQTYGARLPASLPASSVWHDLVAERFSLSATPSDVAFSSRAGAAFRSIAKSRLWGQDLWTDLVGPALGCDLDVESWRRGAIPAAEDSDQQHDVVDALTIDLQPLGVPYAWQNAKDHAKWAATLGGNDDWVCVADINRQVSQSKRGGGAICFRESRLWAALSQI
ncbi:MAG TPA: deoxyribonuclease II family protein, partial [Ardenticatenaceae bacterium]|nr:deoxyribonuclease II family protein [Ardenticatenaceae bacterium]